MIAAASSYVSVRLGRTCTDIAGFSSGVAVYQHALPVGAVAMDSAIMVFVKQHHGVAIGEETTIRVRVTLGAAYPPRPERSMEARGRSIQTGVPTTVLLGSGEVCAALLEPIGAITAAVITAVRQVQGALEQGVTLGGLTLTGDAPLLADLDVMLHDKTGLPVEFVDPNSARTPG